MIPEEELKKLSESFVKVFDLSKPPLIRAKLIEVGADKHILLLDIHHIIVDGTSFGILAKEILSFYEGKELEPLRIQYKDYADWQNKFFQTQEIKTQEEYWLEQFKDEIPVLNLPTDFIRPPMQSFEGKRIYLNVDKTTTKRLKQICSQTETTLFMMILAAFNVLLCRYTGQEDIVVGTPVAGRRHSDLENVVGIFVNTLPIRTYPNGYIKFSEYLRNIKEAVLMALENQDYQYEMLIEKLNIQRDMSRNPLFDVMFVLQNVNMPKFRTGNLKFSNYKLENNKSKFDVNFTATEKNEEIEFEIEYCTKLFKDDTIERLKGHFLNLLKDISIHTEKLISDIEILGEEEKHKILYEFNDTYAEYPRDKTVHELFEEQVERTPDNIAVVFEDEN